VTDRHYRQTGIPDRQQLQGDERSRQTGVPDRQQLQTAVRDRHAGSPDRQQLRTDGHFRQTAVTVTHIVTQSFELRAGVVHRGLHNRSCTTSLHDLKTLRASKGTTSELVCAHAFLRGTTFLSCADFYLIDMFFKYNTV